MFESAAVSYLLTVKGSIGRHEINTLVDTALGSHRFVRIVDAPVLVVIRCTCTSCDQMHMY